jgi:hypothetical protein
VLTLDLLPPPGPGAEHTTINRDPGPLTYPLLVSVNMQVLATEMLAIHSPPLPPISDDAYVPEEPVATFIVPDWGHNVDSGIGLS